MGNVDSRSKFNTGYLMFQTDKPFYMPGELVTGKVFLRALVPIDAKHIQLQIKGKEKASWVDRETRSVQKDDGTQGFEVVDIKRKGHREIFEHKAPCFHFAPQGLVPGDYVIPIQF